MGKPTLFKIISLIFFILLVGIQKSSAQNFDFISHPKLDFRFDYLKLNLKVHPGENLLEGRAEYRAIANIGGADSLVLDAAHMDIKDVQLDGSTVEFRLENDSLFIGLNQPSRKGQPYILNIIYRTKPAFGVHFEPGGSVWSSFLPLSTRHWVPVVDHPRITFTTDITLSVPPSMTGLAPGRKISEQIVSVEEKQVQWKSQRPVPASAIWFAVGSFEQENASAGIKKIILSKPAGQISTGLLEDAYRALNAIVEEAGEYPYETLHIVVLDDHRWETKAYGAGVVYLFKNHGNFASQIYRGVAAQWFGVFHREELWAGAETMNLHQTALLNSVFDTAAMIVSDSENPESVNPYHIFSAKQWNKWQRFYPFWTDTTWKETIEQNLKIFLTKDGGVKFWHHFAEVWYDQSGQPWFRPPELIPEEDSVVTDSITYRVEYTYDEINSELTLSFKAQDSVVTELVSLPLIQHSGDKTDSLQVTFTGAEDSVLINLDPAVSYVSIDASGNKNIYLEEKKPIPFILNQLRSADSPKAKAAAARQLGNHSENPDLQLAIMDMLTKEKDPIVRAALLSSLGEITKGAAGTEQMFLDALKKDQTSVQIAAAKALKHYRNNPRVNQALRNVALQDDSLKLFKPVVESLVVTADSSLLIQFTQEIINQDSTGRKAIYALQKLAGHTDNEAVIKNLSILINAKYPFTVRSEALSTLVQIDENSERWENRIKDLLYDNDPRIRFITVQAITEIEQLNLESILNERLLDEYDGRVYYEMRKEGLKD